MELDTKLIRDQTHHHHHHHHHHATQQPLFLSENYMKPDMPFEVPSSQSTHDHHAITYNLQDFDHHDHHDDDQFINHNGSSSSSNPFAVESFDAFPYNYSSSPLSSNFDFYECKPFAADHHNIDEYNSGNGQVMDNFKSGGYMNHHHHQVNPIDHHIIIGSDRQSHMQLDFQEIMKPLNLIVSDEVSISCVSADDHKGRYYKKAGLNKNNNKAYSSIRETMIIGKKSNVVKGQWATDEDRLLIRLVDQFGTRKWSHIAQMLTGRIGKQCRERWHNHLRPDIKKDTWSEEEDKALIEAHAELGNKWAEIAKRLPGRTENSIKNHWNATKRRQFSKRKCRSKYPRASVLQDYIKSLNLEAATSSSKYQRKYSSKNNTNTKSKASGFCPSDDLMVPDFDFNDFDFDENLFDGNCRIDSLIEELHCAPPPVPLDLAPVKKELDLMEMISQANI